jgi:hypothetical protein
MFDVKDPIIIDNGILRYEYDRYEPEAHNNLNSNKDIKVHPAGSYLLIEGSLKKADGAAYANDDEVMLVNNGIMFLFDSIK